MPRRSFLLGGSALLLGGLYAARALLRRSRRIDSFEGKVVLITGGSRGLGLLLARRFAAEGAHIVLIARNSRELQRAKQELDASRAASVAVYEADITDRAQVRTIVAGTRARVGPVDVLINNAGVIQVGPIDAMTLEDFEESMDVHYWASLYTIMAVLPEMRRRRQGRILNITSIGGKVSVPHLLPYSGSKFALVGLSEGLRAELLKDNILVTTVCPGLMRTGSHINAHFKGQNQAEYTWFSIMNGLPISSISADQAADLVVDACRHGDPELIISPQAQLLAKVHGVLPGLVEDFLGLVDRILPGPGGIGTEKATGRASQSRIAPSILTFLSDRAAQKNNEV